MKLKIFALAAAVVALVMLLTSCEKKEPTMEAKFAVIPMDITYVNKNFDYKSLDEEYKATLDTAVFEKGSWKMPEYEGVDGVKPKNISANFYDGYVVKTEGDYIDDYLMGIAKNPNKYIWKTAQSERYYCHIWGNEPDFEAGEYIYFRGVTARITDELFLTFSYLIKADVEMSEEDIDKKIFSMLDSFTFVEVRESEAPWVPEDEELIRDLIEGRIWGYDFNWYNSKEDGIEFYFGDTGETAQFPYGNWSEHSMAPFASQDIIAVAVRTYEGDTKTVEIHTSIDRGESWNAGEIVLDGTEPMEHTPNLYFINAKTGYYLMETAADESGIYKTEDGGENWKKVKEIPVNLYGIHFFSGKIWIYGEAEGFPILYNTDENITVLEEVILDFNEKEYSSLWPRSDAFRSREKVGVFAVTGRDLQENRADKIYVTEDGGETWNELDITE